MKPETEINVAQSVSHVEISKNTRGESFTVKVYDEKVEDASEKCQRIYEELKAKYSNPNL